MLRYRLDSYVPAGGIYHIARVFFQANQRAQVHWQDFAEVFWVEAGRGVHIINDQRIELEPGDVVLMRKRDVHGLAPRGRDGLTFVNVAFHAHHLSRLRKRYYQEEVWPWEGGVLPTSQRLSASRIRQLGRHLEEMQVQGQCLRALDRFLLNLLASVEPLGKLGGINQYDLPGWLTHGMQRFAGDRDAICRGIPGLAKYCNKSREHVSRTIRQCMACSATQWITLVRLDLAEADLRLTDKAILDIAMGCGMPNLSNFYQRFKQRYGVTPRRYRLGARALVG